jgi:hypothetical protein
MFPSLLGLFRLHDSHWALKLGGETIASILKMLRQSCVGIAVVVISSLHCRDLLKVLYY